VIGARDRRDHSGPEAQAIVPGRDGPRARGGAARGDGERLRHPDLAVPAQYLFAHRRRLDRARHARAPRPRRSRGRSTRPAARPTAARPRTASRSSGWGPRFSGPSPSSVRGPPHHTSTSRRRSGWSRSPRSISPPPRARSPPRSPPGLAIDDAIEQAVQIDRLDEVLIEASRLTALLIGLLSIAAQGDQARRRALHRLA